MPEDSPNTCPRCQAALSPNAAAGQCPACLLRLVQAVLSEPTDPEALDLLANSPKRLGDYELLEVIGRGGMSVVFKARQRNPNRIVALKLLAGGQLASEADIVRFQHEAEAAAQLRHPNIVEIYEVGESDGQHFYAMPWIEGSSLDQGIRKFSTDLKAAAELMSKVARAVHYAHQRGLLHRDLKPANILLDQRGEPFVTDFGLALWLDHRHSLTLTGRLVGTPAYLSPEQAEGRRDRVTVTSDVFSLGVILYELLTGRQPFTGETALAILDQVRREDPLPPSRLNSAVDRDLETICLKCLEKNPASRYPSAETLAEDLDRWLRHEPVHARPLGWAERSRKWVRKHPRQVVMAGALALALITPTVVATWFILRLNHARGHHEVRLMRGNELTLPIISWKDGRCTDNFSGTPFPHKYQQRVRVELTGLPTDLRSKLKVQVQADWAIFDDPVRSEVVGDGDEFVLVVNIERKWLQDNLLYFSAVGWDVGDVAVTHTNAAIRMTLLNRPPRDRRFPE